MPPQHEVALFAASQLLRPELKLSDYASVVAQSGPVELYVCPHVTKPPPAKPKASARPTDARKGATSGGTDATPGSGPDGMDATMRKGLPPDQLELLNAMAAAHPAEHKAAMLQLQENISATLQQAGLSVDNLRIEFDGVLDAPPAGAPVPGAGEPSGEGRQIGTLPMRSGLMGPTRRMPAMIPLSSLLDGATLPNGQPGLARENLAGKMRANAEAMMAECQAQSDAELEKVCAKMVSEMKPTAASGSTVTSEEARRAAKKEEASWGKGLAKGFFSARPKRKGKPAACKQPAPEPASEPACSVMPKDICTEVAADVTADAAADVAVETRPPKRVATACKGDRCASCACRLPITASLQSKCRCGQLFCGQHMHSHVCNFDYRAATQRQLRDETPVIAPAKLHSSV